LETLALRENEPIKLRRLEIIRNEGTHRPLLNNTDLDPDGNYYSDLAMSSEYCSPVQLLHRLKEVSHPFPIVHLNCRSITHKINEIQALLHQLSVNILAVTETWLTEPMADTIPTETWLTETMVDTIHISGYQFVQKPRKKGRGGGTGFFIREGIEFSIMNLPCADNSNFYESMFIRVASKKCADMVVGVLYRPPGTNLNEFNMEIDVLLATLTTKINPNRKVFLMGDFNVDLLATHVHVPTSDFINCMLTHHFLPLILQPTRITNTTATLIDNIFTNSSRCVIDSAIIISDISDHLPIVTWLDFALDNPPTLKASKPKLVRHISKDSITCLKNSLTTVDWTPVYDLCAENKTTLSYTAFMQIFKPAYDDACPMILQKTSKRNSPVQPWMTKGLLISTKKKEKLYNKYIKKTRLRIKLSLLIIGTNISY
jgi:exonuclease III